MPVQLQQAPVLHVRVEGRSLDVPLAELDLGAASSDADVRHAAARHLGVSPARLADTVVDRHETGNLTVRPQAVFG